MQSSFNRSLSYCVFQDVKRKFVATFFKNSRSFSTSSCWHGRYGHRLVKLWEQKEYTTEPLQVYRTGGRLATGTTVKLPGKKWTSRIGGGLDRKFHWVQHSRMTEDDVLNEIVYHEKVMEIIEDDNRSGHLALMAGPLIRRWILATDGMKVGDIIKNCARHDETGFFGEPGDAYPLSLIPPGTMVCCVEHIPGKGASIARSAGNSCLVVRKTNESVVVQMPSKREISILPQCVAVIGRVSNIEHDDEVWGSAQQSLDYGVRPSSGLWKRKDGRHGRKINPIKPMVVYDEAKILRKKENLED